MKKSSLIITIIIIKELCLLSHASTTCDRAMGGTLCNAVHKVFDTSQGIWDVIYRIHFRCSDIILTKYYLGFYLSNSFSFSCEYKLLSVSLNTKIVYNEYKIFHFVSLCLPAALDISIFKVFWFNFRYYSGLFTMESD